MKYFPLMLTLTMIFPAYSMDNKKVLTMDLLPEEESHQDTEDIEQLMREMQEASLSSLPPRPLSEKARGKLEEHSEEQLLLPRGRQSRDRKADDSSGSEDDDRPRGNVEDLLPPHMSENIDETTLFDLEYFYALQKKAEEGDEEAIEELRQRRNIMSERDAAVERSIQESASKREHIQAEIDARRKVLATLFAKIDEENALIEQKNAEIAKVDAEEAEKKLEQRKIDEQLLLDYFRDLTREPHLRVLSETMTTQAKELVETEPELVAHVKQFIRQHEHTSWFSRWFSLSSWYSNCTVM